MIKLQHVLVYVNSYIFSVHGRGGGAHQHIDVCNTIDVVYYIAYHLYITATITS